MANEVIQHVEGYRNQELDLSSEQLLANVQEVQKRQNLPQSKSLEEFTALDTNGQRKLAVKSYEPGAELNLDIEMETGTGKTYCYIKTMFEMEKLYGWSKFIIVVPSIAIREGVRKSLQVTADHFSETYGKNARCFVYNSRRLHEIESYSSDPGLNIMVINIQAFNSRGADNRRIYEELDDFQTRRPIDVIRDNRPILVLDEPQKMEGKATLDALPKFEPLFILRYSATHRTHHNLIHRLDAVDAYNRKLVKKIAVRGIETRGLPGTSAYLYLEDIQISRENPLARIEIEEKLHSGEIKRRLKRLQVGSDLYDISKGLDEYRGFIISDINFNHDTVEFTNGIVLNAGVAVGDVSESDVRRIQIREAIKTHLEKEAQLFEQGIKVLSLFFIDRVDKYRDYRRTDQLGDYARSFEQEYSDLTNECMSGLSNEEESYRRYLESISPSETHNGYFSIDKKSRRLKDPVARKRGEAIGLSDDVEAFDLILKDKERLLSFDEPTRFVFSHSALREGWDNPNVFVMCMLKHSESNISRRQEVGRGLRLCVDQHGNRIDLPEVAHNINVLTVVANESYHDFVAGLQSEVAFTLSARPRKANDAYFVGKILNLDGRNLEITPRLARQITRYLIKNDYTDDEDQITTRYRLARELNELAQIPEELLPFENQVLNLIDSVFDESRLPSIDDGRKTKTNYLNSNFYMAEFQELWARINSKCIYRVDFQSDELIEKAIAAINSSLHVTPLQYIVQSGEQTSDVSSAEVRAGRSFGLTQTKSERAERANTNVAYDLVGRVAENVQITRNTSALILNGIDKEVFGQYRINPEQFIAHVSRLISEQKATTIVEKLRYDLIGESYDASIFTSAQAGQDFSRATRKLEKHVYDYCVTDSDVERHFVEQLDVANEVVVYAKLPRGFLIPTPVANYNPDWAIAFEREKIKHVYFVAETKGSMLSMSLRGIEKVKIDCAERFFAELNERLDTDKVIYDVIPDYEKLIDLVRPPT